MRRLTLLLIACCCLAAGLGCADATLDANSARPSQAGKKTPGPICRKASKRLLTGIATGVQTSGKAKLRHGYITRSEDFKKVFMVAADIQAPGFLGADDVAVWATTSPNGNGFVFAVDGVAQERSDWGDADRTDPAIEEAADGVQRARGCAEENSVP
ncbi:MAG TPA: hypothetical protein VEY49_10890 [Solirubrobacteraceae bacterium]|nr:hypothetical protein [Solirubrobacteraceae bacterium]